MLAIIIAIVGLIIAIVGLIIPLSGIRSRLSAIEERVKLISLETVGAISLLGGLIRRIFEEPLYNIARSSMRSSQLPHEAEVVSLINKAIEQLTLEVKVTKLEVFEEITLDEYKQGPPFDIVDKAIIKASQIKPNKRYAIITTLKDKEREYTVASTCYVNDKGEAKLESYDILNVVFTPADLELEERKGAIKEFLSGRAKIMGELIIPVIFRALVSLALKSE